MCPLSLAYINIKCFHNDDYFAKFALDLMFHLIQTFMKKFIIVEVSLQTRNPKEPFKKVFSRQVEYIDELMFPYAQVVNTLSLLFGSDSVVSFSVHTVISHER